MKKIFSTLVLIFFCVSLAHAKTVTFKGTMPEKNLFKITRWNDPKNGLGIIYNIEMTQDPSSQKFQYIIEFNYTRFKKPKLKNLRAVLLEYTYRDKVGAFFIKNIPGSVQQEHTLDLRQNPNQAGYVTKMLEMDLQRATEPFILNFID